MSDTTTSVHSGDVMYEAQCTRTARFTHLLLWNFIYLLLSHIFSMYYLEHSATNELASPETLARFQAPLPYQLRILIPLLSDAIEFLSGIPVRQLSGILTLGATYGVFVSFRYLLAQFVPAAAASAYALIILVPLFYNYVANDVYAYFYPYDIPSIALCSVCLALAIRRSFCWYFLFFTIATFNRETSWFVALCTSAILFRHLSTKRWIFVVALQLAIWIAIKATLIALFSHNGGSSLFQLQYGENLKTFSSMIAGDPKASRWLIVFGCVWMVIPISRVKLPRQVKILLWLTPIFFAAMLVVGNFNELRVYNELIPIITLAASLCLYRSGDVFIRPQVHDSSQPSAKILASGVAESDASPSLPA